MSAGPGLQKVTAQGWVSVQDPGAVSLVKHHFFHKGDVGAELRCVNWRHEDVLLLWLGFSRSPVLKARHVCLMLMSLASALPVISLAPPAARKVLSFPFHLGAGLWGSRAFRRRRSLSVGVNTQQ